MYGLGPFERRIAFRYLRGPEGSEEGRGFLRFILFAAIGGVVVGTASLLLALAIVRGFSLEIEKKVLAFGAPVQIEHIRYQPIEGAPDEIERIRGLDRVSGVSPVIQEFALLRAGETEIDGVSVTGVEEAPVFLRERVVAGAFDLRTNEADGGLVMGRALADQLGVTLGERVTIFSVRESGGRGIGRPRVAQFEVTGIYETMLTDFDEVQVYVHVGEARRLFRYADDQVTRLDVNLKTLDAEQVHAAVDELESLLGFPLMVRSVYEVHSGLFSWVKLQESIIPLVIGIIIFVAAFNIIGTLLMLIVEKSSALGVLASLGASARQIRRLFLLLGLLIGALGTSLGMLAALLISVLQQQFGLIPLPAEAYYMDTAPIAIHLLDYVVVSLVALAMCALAAYLPARSASRIDPIRVIRFR